MNQILRIETDESPLPRGRLPRYRSPSDARSKVGDAIHGGYERELDPTQRWVDLLKGARYEDR